MRDYIFTSESVAAGHPDKVCDFISDSILDAFLRAEPEARVAVECLASTNRVILAGEVRPHGLLDAPALEALVRAAVREIGYTQDGFHWQKLKIESCLNEQSPDIAQGVDGQGRAEAEGAGDQGAMFGYACRETAALMPAPVHYAHEILRRLDERRRAGALTGLGPDAKTQLSLRYRDGMPHGTEKLVLSVQHEDGVRADELRALVTPIVAEVLPAEWMPPAERFLVNPTGRFVIGGTQAKPGLDRAKIIMAPMAAQRPMAAAHFRARTRPRWTALRLMRRAIWQKMWWQRGWQSAARCSSPMRLGWRSRWRCMWICTAPARWMRRSFCARCRGRWI